jgi:hypothetical protein
MAEISHTHVERDPRPIILFETFGFDNTGHIDMNVSDEVVYIPKDSPPADQSMMGFFITTAEAETQLQIELRNGGCVLDNPNIHKLFTLADVEMGKNEATGVYTHYYDVPDAREYSMFFANCQPNSVVSMKVRLAFYNIEAGGKKDYLPAGKTQLPKLFFLCFLIYAIAAGVWIYICYRAKATVHKIHWLMGGLVFLKALTVLTQAGMYSWIKTTGQPDGWNIAFYVFSFFRGIMLFVVIVLIGTGWSFLKPFLQDKEKKVMMIVIPLQVLANIAVVILDETGPSNREWFTWRDILHLVDIICCCAILFPIVWSIKHLREAASTDGKAARNLIKLTLFRQFYVMVVSYIYFTRIVVYLLKSTTPYHYAWTADLADQAAALLFYVLTGYKFRPVEQNPYFVLDDEEEEAAREALRDEEFDL